MVIKVIMGIWVGILILISAVIPSYADQIISRIEFNDAPVLDVIKILAEQADLNLSISGDTGLLVNKRVTLNLVEASAERTLDDVLLSNGLTFEYQGDSLSVMVGQPGRPEGQGKFVCISLKYITADQVEKLIGKIMPGVRASAGVSSKDIILHGEPQQIVRATELLGQIDQPIPQVLIESQVLEISSADLIRIGATYGEENGVFNSTEPEIAATINALMGTGKANVIATPKIATLDGHEAVINIGSRIPYAVPVSAGSGNTQWAVQYIDAGVKLKITPYLGEGGSITTFIQPEVSSVSEWRTTAAGEFPVITTRNAQATLRVMDGETIVVGGLLSETERENLVKLPILGHLPIAGLLFQNRTFEKAKSEIVFLITPHLI
ncbi:MAG: type II and III secretion system protein [bacterium]